MQFFVVFSFSRYGAITFLRISLISIIIVTQFFGLVLLVVLISSQCFRFKQWHGLLIIISVSFFFVSFYVFSSQYHPNSLQFSRRQRILDQPRRPVFRLQLLIPKMFRVALLSAHFLWSGLSFQQLIPFFVSVLASLLNPCELEKVPLWSIIYGPQTMDNNV